LRAKNIASSPAAKAAMRATDGGAASCARRAREARHAYSPASAAMPMTLLMWTENPVGPFGERGS